MLLDPLEIATTLVLGRDGAASAPWPQAPRSHPLDSLETATAELLERGPCFVAFSGGRDSSAVLAAAARAARACGLPLPVPLTLRYPEAPDTEESAWQEAVVGHLRLPDWERVPIRWELEMLGDLDSASLRRHGLRYPANAHMLVPLLERSAGGTLLTGLDGDSLFGSWGWLALADALGRRRPLAPRDALRAAKALTGPRLGRRLTRRRASVPLPWLRPDAQLALDRRWAGHAASEPWRWSARVPWVAGQRHLRIGLATLADLAGQAGARIAHPLLDHRFLAALARHGGPTGYGDRTAVMRALFAGVLPDELLARPTKATFSTPLWGPRARAFVAGWDGTGVDEAVVDPEGLRAVWQRDRSDFRTSLLLKVAWLAAQGLPQAARG